MKLLLLNIHLAGFLYLLLISKFLFIQAYCYQFQINVKQY